MASSFDVIVPCYRYGHYLRQCVESILRQENVQVRALIIDDASPDNTPEVAAELAASDDRVVYVRHEKNMRHIATYNDGFSRVTADYVLLLSADDYLLPGALARAASILDQRHDVGMVFGRARAELDDGTTIAMQPFNGYRLMTGEEYIHHFAGRNEVPTPTAVVRTSVQMDAGFYNPRLPHSGDMEMWLRIASRSNIAYIDAEQAVYRRHSGNMSLSYYESMVPDIEQRRAAIESFLAADGHLLADAGASRQRMLDELARDAVRSASAAFNEGNIALSDQLRNLASELSGSVRQSRQWRNLEIKRVLGQRVWQSLAGWRKPRTVI